MNGWVVFYLMIYVGLGVAGLWIDFRENRPAWFLAAAVLSDTVIVYLFSSFYYPALRVRLDPYEPAVQILYVAALAWQAFQFQDEFRNPDPDPELSEDQRNRMAHIGLVGATALCLPAFVGAGFAAFAS